MERYEAIRARAAARKGGEAALAALIVVEDKTPEAIALTPDSAILTLMTRRIFQAGLNWKVVDAKWPAFDAAFDGFDIGRTRMMDDETLDRLAGDPALIRNRPKMHAVRTNAQLLHDLAVEHGSAARAVAQWPIEEQAALVDLLTKRGAYLGGQAAMRVIRELGKESWVNTPAVTAALIAAGAVDRAPTSAKAMRAVQAAFNAWKAQSGLSMTAISKTLAMSVEV